MNLNPHTTYRTLDPVRRVSVVCTTCPFHVVHADDGMAQRHADHNPGHVVRNLVTVSFTTELVTRYTPADVTVLDG